MSDQDDSRPAPDLSALRESIDDIDSRLLALLAERADVVANVGAAKAREGAPVLDPEREKALLEKVVAKGAGRFPKDAIVAVYREILSGSVSLQGRVTVAYLGPAGTYSHVAARTLFGYAPRYFEEATIESVFDAVRRKRALYGVVPLENATEGSVTSAVDALLEGGTQIRRELILPITHCLLSHASSLSEITRVYSHPQALAQCRRFLSHNMPQAQVVATTSTSMAVREAASDAAGAAIASALAGELNRVPVLRDGIQDLATNATRFVMIGEHDAKPTGDDKTTLAFWMKGDTERGALRRALESLDDAGVNMTRIESRPTRAEAWRYAFVIDVEGHRSDEHVGRGLEALGARCDRVEVLGSYPRYLPPR